MKRFAVLLAVAAMGTGCDNHPSSGDVNLYWEFARHAPAATGGFVLYDTSDPGGPSGKCPQSDVDTVVVVDPAGAAQSLPCVNQGVLGVRFPGVSGGVTFTSRIQGYRSSTLVYDSGPFDVHVDGTVSRIVDVIGVSAPLDLFGDFGFGTFASNTLAANCSAAGVPNVSFNIVDVFGTLIDGGLVGCADPLPSPVFADNLDLDNFWVRMTATGGFDSCWQALDHFAADTGSNGFSYLMVSQPGACTQPF